jgi:hypothetical protein
MTIPIYNKYQKFIEARFDLINKEGERIPFLFNNPQSLLVQKATGKDILLKARQEGFSTEISGLFTADFLLKENILSVVIADNSDNAQGLLEKPKFFIKSYEEKMHCKVPMKYNSKHEMYNLATGSRYLVGTAENADFGRSRTIHNLHMSEAAFYKYLKKMLASALQALTPNGKAFIETTANGFNDFKEVWDDAVLGINSLNPLFFGGSLLYDQTFLANKLRELGEQLFMQEYPDTPEEAFITSGAGYFDKLALRQFLDEAKQWEVQHAGLARV